MPFNPALPLENSEMRSEEMRNQFIGLKDLIDAIPPASPETDPVFTASEAALLVPGDKANIDAAAAFVADPLIPTFSQVVARTDGDCGNATLNNCGPIGTPNNTVAIYPLERWLTDVDEQPVLDWKHQAAAVADPVGGAVVDAECRAQLVELLNRLRAYKLLPPS